MAALTPTPVLPEAILVGPLSARSGRHGSLIREIKNVKAVMVSLVESLLHPAHNSRAFLPSWDLAHLFPLNLKWPRFGATLHLKHQICRGI